VVWVCGVWWVLGVCGAWWQLKCAAYGLIPVTADTALSEVQLPETSGFALSTGNLGDITKDSGNMSSLSVLDRLFLQGSLALGDATQGDHLASLSVNSAVLGLRLVPCMVASGACAVSPPLYCRFAVLARVSRGMRRVGARPWALWRPRLHYRLLTLCPAAY